MRRPYFVPSLIVAMLAVGSPASASVTTGDLDKTFGTAGLVHTSIGDASADDVVRQSSGKLVAGGSGYDGAESTAALVRYTTSGALDATFGTNGTASGPPSNATDLALGPADEIYAAIDRWCETCRTISAAKFTAAGALVTSFGSAGVASMSFDAGSYERVTSDGIAVLADGSVLVVGTLRDLSWNESLLVVRFDPTGAVDTTFGEAGVYTAINVTGDAIAIAAGGKPLVSGTERYSCTEFSCSSRFSVRRLNANGTIDTTFGTSGIARAAIGTQSSAQALAVEAGTGKILIAGTAYPTTAPARMAAARFTAGGALDATFSGDGRAEYPDPTGPSGTAMATTFIAGGKMVLAGSDASQGGFFKLVQLTSTGAIDKVFGVNGWIRTNTGSGYTTAHAILSQPDGKLVAAGYAMMSCPGACQSKFVLARYGIFKAQTAATYAWRNVSAPSAYGGSYRVERIKGASVSFAFSGTSVTWYSVKSPSHGTATVFIDGVSKGTFNNYSSSTTYKFARSFGSLSSGGHTIKIVATGLKGSSAATSTYVSVDAFKVGSTVYSTPSAQYGWQTVNSASALGGSYARTDLAGSALTISFNGRGIVWSTIRGTTMGKARVYLDGVDKGVIDNYRSSTQYGYARTYQASTTGSHTLKVVVSGQRASSATDEMIAIDRFMVY